MLNAASLLLSFALVTPQPAPPAPQQSGTVETVRESRSKVDFPVRLAAVVSAGTPAPAPHRLAGFGLRTKTIFDVKVYAMALYLDPATTLAALAPEAGRDKKALQGDARVYETILKPASGKTLRLVMRRDVDADDMREAFEDALEPRVARAEKEFSMPGGKAALKSLRTFFDLDELEKDQILDFTWHPATAERAGRLEVRVGGEAKGAVENAALGWALFDVYLGGDPIHTKEKPRLIRRLPGLLADFLAERVEESKG